MDEVTQARRAIGLPDNKFHDMSSDISKRLGLSIVCKCTQCGKLFESRSHNLGALEQICKGDCGCQSKKR